MLHRTVENCRRAGLPRFEYLSARDAHLELVLRGSRGEILREYMGYIEQIDPEHAGKLTAGEGESTAAVRRRLGGGSAAAGEEPGGDQGRPGGLLLGK